jgi:hypothetical protein
MSRKNKIVLFLSIALLVFVSYIRDFFFKNINALLGYKSSEGGTNYSDEFFSFLFELDYQQVYMVKWGLLIIFSILFFFLSLMILRSRFVSIKKAVTKYLFLIYLILGTICAITIGLYYIPEISDASYLLSRRILGILHSPIPVMILFLLFHIQEKLEKNA